MTYNIFKCIRNTFTLNSNYTLLATVNEPITNNLDKG